MKDKKAQLKIKQMAFMLIAVFLFFILVGLFFASISYKQFVEKAEKINTENAIEIAASIDSVAEFSCGSLCIDADKLIVFSSENYEKEKFWQVSSIEVRRILQDTNKDIICTKQNYPNCNLFKVYEIGGNATKVSSFVSLCRKEKGDVYAGNEQQAGTNGMYPSYSLITSRAIDDYALAPVTIKGTRFYSNGEPYFLSANFLTLEGAYSKERDCSYLASCMSSSRRANILKILKTSNEYNAHFIWLLIEGEGTTPYKNRLFGGDFDEAKIQDWRNKLTNLIDNDVRPVLWLFPDDAPAIHGTRLDSGASVEEKKRYIKKMVDSFDDLPVMWVLGLEVNEYWSKSYCDELGNYLQSIAKNPVGLHQTGGRTDFMTSDWVDFGMYQYYKWFASNPYRDTITWTKVYTETVQKKAGLGGKPFVAAEYDVEASTAARQRGLAAAFGGAAGTGNGAPAGLYEFMQELPDNMVSSSSEGMLYLQGSGTSATADVENLKFSAESSGEEPSPTPPEDGTQPTPTPPEYEEEPTPTPTYQGEIGIYDKCELARVIIGIKK